MRLLVEGRTLSQLEDYCKMNNISDIRSFALRCLRQGLNIAMYGLSPMDNVRREAEGIIETSIPVVEPEPKVEVIATPITQEVEKVKDPLIVEEVPKQVKESKRKKIRIVKKSTE